MGLYLVFGRFFYQQSLKKRAFYAVTTERILRIRGSRTDFLALDAIQSMHQYGNRDGSSTISFNSELKTVRPYYTRVRGFSRRPDREEPFCLEDIPNVDSVSRLIADQVTG